MGHALADTVICSSVLQTPLKDLQPRRGLLALASGWGYTIVFYLCSVLPLKTPWFEQILWGCSREPV